MHEMWSKLKTEINRRSFMKSGLTAPRRWAPCQYLIGFRGKGARRTQWSSQFLAMQRCLSSAAAAEILETDFWEQYSELGDIQDKEVPAGKR